MSVTSDWELTTFRRIECIAENPSDALVAVDERIRGMRRLGWIIPEDAAVDLRPSGFGWAARLVPPARTWNGHGWELRRRVRSHKVRTVSGIDLVPATVAPATELAKEA